MRVTIDSAGRLILPKPLRDAYGIGPGTLLDISEQDGRLVVEVASPPKRLVRRRGRIVAVADEPMPALTAADVRATLERVRR